MLAVADGWSWAWTTLVTLSWLGVLAVAVGSARKVAARQPVRRRGS
jgi:hypothetical protein